MVSSDEDGSLESFLIAKPSGWESGESVGSVVFIHRV